MVSAGTGGAAAGRRGWTELAVLHGLGLTEACDLLRRATFVEDDEIDGFGDALDLLSRQLARRAGWLVSLLECKLIRFAGREPANL